MERETTVLQSPEHYRSLLRQVSPPTAAVVIALVIAGSVGLLLARSWAGRFSATLFTVLAVFLAVLYIGWDSWRSYLADCLYLTLSAERGSADPREYLRTKMQILDATGWFGLLPLMALVLAVMTVWLWPWALFSDAILIGILALWIALSLLVGWRRPWYRVHLRVELSTWLSERRRESLLQQALDEDPGLRESA
ncbi:MAG: hypothetical protein QMC79_09735 [Anaerosomatales bacterium]|nr:hypothetical protein [Anaerosomatales bacterium]